MAAPVYLPSYFMGYDVQSQLFMICTALLAEVVGVCVCVCVN